MPTAWVTRPKKGTAPPVVEAPQSEVEVAASKPAVPSPVAMALESSPRLSNPGSDRLCQVEDMDVTGSGKPAP
jgi:hypothetical protein